MNYELLFATLLLAPFFGFLANGLNYRRFGNSLAGSIATAGIGLSFLCSVVLVSQLASLPEAERVLRVSFFSWLSVGNLNVNAGFLLDPISAVMILVITGVGTLIHVFSIGYMSDDKTPAKYFCYLNLFVFNMLLLVLGDNLLVMFVGWEGVGLCSYLLIGYWFTDKAKAAAGMKAFITNRIGDAGFLIGIFILFAALGTLEFPELILRLPGGIETGWTGPLTLACLALFVGASGKSAQIPLYVWLPDAMAGPTPVSALIHAATMVTAGVYMIVRLSPLFALAPNAMMVVAIVGAVTALVAATIGLTQWDIKKILAYSTVSQLGYMFLAVGVGAFGAGLFHLMTHAFFKALMFLGAGSVIHAMHHEQDIRKMGGLSKKMPMTHLTFVCGWLAIIGVPPLAGFFSKDEILWMSVHSPRGHILLWLVGLTAAGFTAFYMTRLMALTFWGKSRVEGNKQPHESPFTMTVPLCVLAALSVVGGWLGIPHIIGDVFGHLPNVLEHWLAGYIAALEMPPPRIDLEWRVMLASLSMAAIGAISAAWFYLHRPDLPARIANKIKPLYNLVYNKYWVDEFYFKNLINPIVESAKGLWLYIDVNFIDKTTYVLSDVVKGASSGLRSLQNGNIQMYALYFALGLFVAMAVVLR